jgi:two-component system OmpR family sensor kinase
MVHSTISDHGGTISVDSKVGQGTTFAVRLPYHQEHDS